MTDAQVGPVVASKARGDGPLAEVVIFAAQQRAANAPEMLGEAAQRVVDRTADDQIRADGGARAEILCVAVVEQGKRRRHPPVSPVLFDA